MGRINENDLESIEERHVRGAKEINQQALKKVRLGIAIINESKILDEGEKSLSKIISIEKIYNDRGSLNRAVEEVKKKILNKHDYILNLLDYSVEV